MINLEPSGHQCKEAPDYPVSEDIRRHVPAGWPYGPNVCGMSQHALMRWAKPRGLTFAGDGMQDALKWLLRGTGIRLPVDPVSAWHAGLADHLSAWKRDGVRALLVFQPYHISDGDREELSLLASRLPVLDISVDRTPSWYGHGTHFIEIARRDLSPV